MALKILRIGLSITCNKIIYAGIYVAWQDAIA